MNATGPCRCGDLTPAPLGICQDCLLLLNSDEIIEAIVGVGLSIRLSQPIDSDGASVVVSRDGWIVGTGRAGNLRDALVSALDEAGLEGE